LARTFNSNIFVKYLPAEIKEDEIRKVFGEVGNIISVKITPSVKKFQGEEITSYSFGFILFEKVEEAQAAIKKFDNSTVFGNRPLKVEQWISKDEIQQEKK
jgi:RNA recognition motif-containing protein